MPALDTADLLARCRRGDDLAWEELVRRYQGRVYGLAWHYLRDREEAKDAAQEVFVRVYRRFGSLREGEAFLPWLLRVARNHCIDRIRRARARGSEDRVDLEDAGDLAAREPGPERRALAGDRRRLLHRALDDLTETNREMILLKEIQGLKLEEISALLSIPLGTAKSRSNRARIALAGAVRALHPEEGG